MGDALGLHYRVLGPLEVLDDGRGVELGRPKQRAALAVLILESNRVVSVDRVIDLVWRGEPPAHSAASLQVYVSNLRRVLEPGRAPRSPSTVLLTRPPGYTLRMGPEQLDAACFENLVAHGHRSLAEGRPHVARQALDEALALWRGEVLADFGYEEFVRPAALRWEGLRQVAVEDRIEADLALGDHASAIGNLEAILAETPLRERLWALLMVALYRSGRQGDALRAYTSARAALVEELGVDPGPDLVGLQHDILNHAPSLEWRQPSPSRDNLPGVHSGPVTPTARKPSRPAHRSPLVGRVDQLNVLTRAYDEARRGGGGVVLIAGEAGIGKSRLAEELAARAEALGAEVVWGRCHEGEGAPAFWPWLEVMRAALAQIDPAVLRHAVGNGAAPLAELVPEAAQVLGEPGVAPLASAEAARFRLYEAVMATLRALAALRCLVVILDDLHWADVTSLAVSEFVAARLDGVRLLLVGTYRPTELTPDHPLLSTLAVMARQARPNRLWLGGLSEAEVARNVAHASGEEPSPQLAAALHARTEGNPFFLAELVKLLMSEGTLGRPSAVTSAPVPPGVRDVVLRALGRLPEATLELLRMAAVIGREFDIELLSRAIGQDDEHVLEGVEAALVAGILVEAGGSIGKYRFAHTLVQETIYAELSSMRRSRLSDRLGEAMGTLRGIADCLPPLAHQLLMASVATGARKGIDYAIAIAPRGHPSEDEKQLLGVLASLGTMAAGISSATSGALSQQSLAAMLTEALGATLRDAGRAWLLPAAYLFAIEDHGPPREPRNPRAAPG